MGALFLGVWAPLQPRREHLPTSDLYTHLTVARHLLRGDGFVTDVTYPLSFAYPFACRLPQPLIHRMPGYAAVLTVPTLTAILDPGRTLVHVRRMQFLLVALLAGLGAWCLFRAGAGVAVGMWAVILGASPLLGFAASWGHDEVLVSLLLTAAWLLLRLADCDLPLTTGALAGAVGLVRLELVWIPLLWWLALRGRRWGFWLAAAAALVILMPWSLRTLHLTGQPFFTLQGVAEHAKDTRAFPEYTVYRGLQPQPLLQTLLTDPEPVARKTMRGLRFFGGELGRFLPVPWLGALAVSASVAAAATAARAVRRRRRRGDPPDAAGTVARRVRPTAAAAATLPLLILLYSPFDHSLRHLTVLLPVLAWELSLAAACLLAPAGRARAYAVGVGLAAVALLAAWRFPCRLPGWEGAADDAAALAPLVRQESAAARKAPAGVMFVQYAAVPWFADRPGVWSPLDAEVASTIAARLENPGP